MGCSRAGSNPVRSVLFLFSFSSLAVPFTFIDKHTAISSGQHFFLRPTATTLINLCRRLQDSKTPNKQLPIFQSNNLEARRPAERLRWPITITANNAVLSTEGWPIHLSDVVCAHYVAAAMAEWLRRWTRNPMGYSRTGSNPVRSVQQYSFYVLGRTRPPLT